MVYVSLSYCETWVEEVDIDGWKNGLWKLWQAPVSVHASNILNYTSSSSLELFFTPRKGRVKVDDEPDSSRGQRYNVDSEVQKHASLFSHTR